MRPEDTLIENWSDLDKLFASFDYGRPSQLPYLFRGQSKALWDLVDSFSRLLTPIRYMQTPLDIELLAYRKFVNQAHLFLDPCSLPEEESLLAWWSLMQHFECPTRLLDWTASPNVATYFAVVENEDEPGAVWVLDGAAVINEATQEDVREARKTLSTSKDVWNVFWDEKHIEFVHPFLLKRHNPRIASQQGAFTVCGTIPRDHCDMIMKSCNGLAKCPLSKIIIAPGLKAVALRRLMKMNITANTLFPGLDGLGRSIKEMITLEVLNIDPW
jgi:FRG domain